MKGIARRPESKHLLVIGRLWPKLYEIRLALQ
ncbi:MAG: glutaminyl-peptide cyclotransferase [Sedimentisphaerales bacterium]|nr:glutaminyl-peptide cyclotransferase [Sedimentisphaerales bacterium]